MIDSWYKTDFLNVEFSFLERWENYRDQHRRRVMEVRGRCSDAAGAAQVHAFDE
jgi:hypothetical protein